jgi:hypothetical protein
MEYRIHLPQPIQEHPTRFEALLLETDPSALLDVVPAGVVRVATTLGQLELTELLRAQDGPLTDARVELLPSICCGGCSG